MRTGRAAPHPRRAKPHSGGRTRRSRVGSRPQQRGPPMTREHSNQSTPETDASQWWATSISRIAPNVIEFRGEPIAEVIRDRGLTETLWLLLRGGRPTATQVRLLEAAMV